MKGQDAPGERVRADLVSLSARLRAEFLAGAEERSLRELGRRLTPAELVRVMARYPGDWTREPGPQARQPRTLSEDGSFE